MKKKYSFKNQGSMQRRIIAGGLTAAFVFGTVDSGLAGAMKEHRENYWKDVNELKNLVISNKDKSEELLKCIPNTAGEILEIILGEDYNEQKKNYVFNPKKVIDDETKKKILKKVCQNQAEKVADNCDGLDEEAKKNYNDSLNSEIV